MELVELLALSQLKQFLGCSTPIPWVEKALEEQDILLIDHAHCEKKQLLLRCSSCFTTQPELIC